MQVLAIQQANGRAGFTGEHNVGEKRRAAKPASLAGDEAGDLVAVRHLPELGWQVRGNTPAAILSDSGQPPP